MLIGRLHNDQFTKMVDPATFLNKAVHGGYEKDDIIILKMSRGACGLAREPFRITARTRSSS